MTYDERSIVSAIAALRRITYSVPRPLPAPTEDQITEAELELGVTFSPTYRRFLEEASHLNAGNMEPGVVTPKGGHRDLVQLAREGWEMGVPTTWLPFCEDNGDYYCLDGEVVRFWDHNGTTDEHWEDLATWLIEVWIAGG